jgi:hypothetical protein
MNTMYVVIWRFSRLIKSGHHNEHHVEIWLLEQFFIFIPI